MPANNFLTESGSSINRGLRGVSSSVDTSSRAVGSLTNEEALNIGTVNRRDEIVHKQWQTTTILSGSVNTSEPQFGKPLVECNTSFLENYYKGNKGWGEGWATGARPSDTRPLISNPVEGTNATDSRLNGALGIKIDLEQDGNFTRLGMESGLINSPISAHVVANEQDTERITKMLSTPRGVKWEAHNIEAGTLTQKLKQGLVRTDNVSDSTFLDRVRNFGDNVLRGALTAGALTTNLLAQVAVAGTGVHMTPFLGNSYIRGIGGTLSAILNLGQDGYSAAEIAQEGGYDKVAPAGNVELEYGLVKEQVDSKTVVSYSRRPGGSRFQREDENNEIIFRVTGSLLDYSGDIDGNFSKKPVGGSAYAFKKPFGLVSGSVNNNSTNYIIGKRYSRNSQYGREGEDFKELSIGTVDSSSGNPITYGNVENGIHNDKQGNKLKSNNLPGISRAVASGTKAFEADNISSLLTFGSTFEDLPGIVNDHEYSPETAEKYGLIPFAIASIIPGSNTKRYLYFQANLDSYEDNYSGEWEGIRYVGRAEQFYTYKGFTREVSFKFKALARRKSELEKLYSELNYLAGITAPSYDSEGKFMRGTLSEVTIGDMLKHQPGIIKNVGFSWDVDVPWNVVVKKNESEKEEEVQQLMVPHMLSVSISFTPIHNFNVTSRPDGNDLYFGLKE